MHYDNFFVLPEQLIRDNDLFWIDTWDLAVSNSENKKQSSFGEVVVEKNRFERMQKFQNSKKHAIFNLSFSGNTKPEIVIC